MSINLKVPDIRELKPRLTVTDKAAPSGGTDRQA